MNEKHPFKEISKLNEFNVFGDTKSGTHVSQAIVNVEGWAMKIEFMLSSC